MTQGILQGESIPQIAKRLTQVTDMTSAAAVRNALTMTTAAENRGRQTGMEDAKSMGINMRKEWLATSDARTRESHISANGQQAEVEKPFMVGGYNLMFPADTSAPAHEVYNCRCTVLTRVLEFDKLSQNALTNDSSFDIMYNNNEKISYNAYRTITDDDISEVPLIMIDGLTKEQCLLIQARGKELLKEASNHKIKTETSYALNMDGYPLSEMRVGKEGNNSVGIDYFNVDHIGLHTHPGESPLGLEDVLVFLSRDNQVIIGEIGLNGSASFLQQTATYNKKKYQDYIDQKTAQTKYNGHSVDNYMENEDLIKKLSDVGKEEFSEIFLSMVINILESGENFGYKYYRKRKE